MRLRTISEGGWNTAGHVALDVAGLVPGLGEAADLTNAMWYIGEKDYLSAALSLVSMIPEIGDLLGKGAKYVGQGSKVGGRLLAKYGPKIQKAWPQVLEFVETSKKLRPYARVLDQTIKNWLSGKYNEPAQSRLPTPTECIDRVPGGLAKGMPDSAFDPEQLRMGIETELEHTSDKAIAREIAKDHLKEDPKYYTKLRKMEGK